MANTNKKKAEEIPPLPEGWSRCHVYIPTKRRYCRQQLLPGSIYCGNHQGTRTVANEDIQATATMHSPSSTTQLANSPSLQVVKVPCPLDPSHWVIADRVAKHVRKCPARKKQQQLEQATFYCQNINKGGHGTKSDPLSMPPQRDLAWAQNVARAVVRLHQRVFAAERHVDEKSVSLAQIENAITLEDLSIAELDAGLEEAIEVNHIKCGGPKHLRQQASLVGHLRRLGAVPAAGSTNVEDETTRDSKKPRTMLHTIVEMGAGRGVLGLVAAGVSAVRTPTNLILIERGASRAKADTVLRNIPKESPEKAEQYMRLGNVKFSRLGCDLAHVKMRTVLEEQQASKIHVIAKHLCGAGTDLALKALEPIKQDVLSYLFATCCHGVCNWDDYVGREYLHNLFSEENIPFGPDEFELLRRWSSGTVMTHLGDAEEHSVLKSSYEEKHVQSSFAIGRIVDSLGLSCGVHGLGRSCQRLIDYGRLQYVQRILLEEREGSKSEIVHYVALDVTPQNAVIRGCM